MIGQYNRFQAADPANQSTCETQQSSMPNNSWQHRFLLLLPAIRRYAQIRFSALSSEAREEMVQETIARALFDYVRLVERSKEHVASATSLACFAVRQVRQGRRVGGRLNCRDVSSAYCRRRAGVTLRSLDHQVEASGDWKEILVEDYKAGPSDTAAARIDFAQWLKTLPRRSRRLAERLATGESTSETARLFGISKSRVSQMRSEFRRAWHAFQGEPVPA